MRLNDLQQLNEDLGNLAKLNVGPLLNVLKQQNYSSSRYGSSISPVDRKFTFGNIGSTSEIVDVGQLKDGIKSLRRAFKTHEDDAVAFAIYIGGTPVMFGTYGAYELAGKSREGRLAYDLTPFSEVIDQIDAEKNAGKSSWQQSATTDRTSYREKEPSKWDRERGQTKTERYQGDMVSTDRLSGLFDTIMAIGKAANQPVTAKLVLSDKVAQEKRRKRYSIKEIEDGKNDLKTRLQKYKLSKKPTVDTIEEFIKYALDNPGKTVQFAGRSYVLKVSSYDKIEPTALLSGTPFSASYSTADPGSYDSLNLTYKFDPREGTLKPVFATWYDKSNPTRPYDRQEAVLDGPGYARMKLKANPTDKAKVLPKLLTMAKNQQWQELGLIVSALRKAGINWDELGIIEKSLAAVKAEKAQD